MMEESSERLEEKHNEKHDPNDGMVVVKIINLMSQVYAHTKCGDEDGVAKELDCSMDPYQTGEVGDADEDAADGEKGYESSRCEDTVGDFDAIAEGEVSAKWHACFGGGGHGGG